MNAYAASAVAAGSRMPETRNLPSSVEPRSAAASVPCPPVLDLPLSSQSTLQNSKSEIPAPLTPEPLNPLTPRRPGAAFSLTEVVIALGIFAVAMVGVLALFPVASATGRESSEESQAAILAQTILCDLRASTRARGAANGWLNRGPDTFNTTQWVFPDLTVTGTFRQAYDLRRRTDGDGAGGVGMVGNPIALKAMSNTVSGSAFTNGLTNVSGAIYLAQTTIRPVTGQPGLAQVEILVQTPANQPQTNRRSFSFNSLVYAR